RGKHSGTPSDPPQIRHDLTGSRQESPAGVAFVVKDPVTGRFFRFGETEGFILEQFDGATPLDVVRSRVEEKFEAALPRETLEKFAERLQKLGMLKSDAVETPHAHRRVRGNLLYLRF